MATRVALHDLDLDRNSQFFTADVIIEVDPYVDPNTSQSFDQFEYYALFDGAQVYGPAEGAGRVDIQQMYSVGVDDGVQLIQINTREIFSGVEYLWQGNFVNNTRALSGQNNAFSGISPTIVFDSDYDDELRLGSGNDYAHGGGGADVIEGDSGRDELHGGSGADHLDGGSDVDNMYGGLGDDIFVVDNSSDVVIEIAGEGTADRVLASATYALATGTNVEFLTTLDLTQATAINLTGNEIGQIIRGNAGANVLRGRGGADELTGYGGNDFYILDDALDTIIETTNGGTDQVYALVNYTLAAGTSIEVLSTGGSGSSGNINLTGNELAQTVIGNAGNNTLNGGGGKDILQGLGGNDNYIVDSADDLVVEVLNGGTDQVYALSTYRLAAGQHVEVINTGGSASTTAINLTGNELNQTIYGNAGANTLTGGGGKDTMQGFGGADLYIVDSADDVVIEAVGGGTDQIFALANYTLAAGQEIEVLNTAGSGTTANTNLTGNALNQTVYGNAGSNVLNGGGGNDVLKGFGGADFFLFNTALGATNIDLIQDFSVADDTIQLENAIFTGLAAGTLVSGALAIGAAATQTDDRIIYNSTTGALSFDADGSGSGAAVRFATLTTGLALTEADFQVI